MAFDMLLRRDDEANEVVSSVIGYAFDIKEKLHGMDRNHWRLVNIDLCGTQRQGLQLQVEPRWVMCSVFSPPPRFEQVRLLIDGENTFLVVFAHDLGSHAIQEAQIVFFFSLVETSFLKRTDRAMVVENDGRRLDRKSDFPSF